MDDAGGVVISSWECCFSQTGVDIRNRISTLWPCKGQRGTFVHFQHFYVMLPSDSALSQSIVSSHSSFWIGFTGQSKCHDMSIVLSCQRNVRASYMQGGCFVPGDCCEVLFFNFFPGLSRLHVWFMTVGQDSRGKKTTKTPGTPWR